MSCLFVCLFVCLYMLRYFLLDNYYIMIFDLQNWKNSLKILKTVHDMYLISVETVNGNVVVPRRDSNTSTLSSYMSSLRSDASPALFNSR